MEEQLAIRAISCGLWSLQVLKCVLLWHLGKSRALLGLSFFLHKKTGLAFIDPKSPIERQRPMGE